MNALLKTSNNFQRHPRFARRPHEVPQKRPKLRYPPSSREASAEQPKRKTRSASRSTVDEDDDELIEYEYVERPARKSRRAAAEEAEAKMLRSSRRRETASDDEFLPPQPRSKTPRKAKKSQLISQRSVSTDSEAERVGMKTRSQRRQDTSVPEVQIQSEDVLPAPQLPLTFMTVEEKCSEWWTVPCTPSDVVNFDATIPVTKAESSVSAKYCLAEIKSKLCPTEAQLTQNLDTVFVLRHQKESTSYEERSLVTRRTDKKIRDISCEKIIDVFDHGRDRYAEKTCRYESTKPSGNVDVPPHTIAFAEIAELSVRVTETRTEVIRTKPVISKVEESININESFFVKTTKEAAILGVSLPKVQKIVQEKDASVEVATLKRPLPAELAESEDAVERKQSRLETTTEETEVQIEEALSSSNITTRKRKQPRQDAVEVKKSKESPAADEDLLADEANQAVWTLRRSATFLVEKATAERNMETDVYKVVTSLVDKIVASEDQDIVAPTSSLSSAQTSPCKDLIVSETRTAQNRIAVLTPQEDRVVAGSSLSDISAVKPSLLADAVSTEPSPCQKLVGLQVPQKKEEPAPSGIVATEPSPSLDLAAVQAPLEIIVDVQSPSEDLLAVQVSSKDAEPLLSPIEHFVATKLSPIEDLTVAEPSPSKEPVASQPAPSEDLVAVPASAAVLAPAEFVLSKDVEAVQIPLEDVVAVKSLPSAAEHFKATELSPVGRLTVAEPTPSPEVVASRSAPTENLATVLVPPEVVPAEVILTEDIEAVHVPLEDAVVAEPTMELSPAGVLPATEPAPSEFIVAAQAPSEDYVDRELCSSSESLAVQGSFLIEDLIALQRSPRKDVITAKPHITEEMIVALVSRGSLIAPEPSSLAELAAAVGTPFVVPPLASPYLTAQDIALKKKLAIKVEEVRTMTISWKNMFCLGKSIPGDPLL